VYQISRFLKLSQRHLDVAFRAYRDAAVAECHPRDLLDSLGPIFDPILPQDVGVYNSPENELPPIVLAATNVQALRADKLAWFATACIQSQRREFQGILGADLYSRIRHYEVFLEIFIVQWSFMT
jgi:hypothetical protein